MVEIISQHERIIQMKPAALQGLLNHMDLKTMLPLAKALSGRRDLLYINKKIIQ